MKTIDIYFRIFHFTMNLSARIFIMASETGMYLTSTLTSTPTDEWKYVFALWWRRSLYFKGGLCLI